MKNRRIFHELELKEEDSMNKKYIVRLSKREREELLDVLKRLKGSSQKVRRAQILLKADARGPNWTDVEQQAAVRPRRERQIQP